MVFSFTLHELRDELRALGHEDLSDDVIMDYLSQLNLPVPLATVTDTNPNPNPNSDINSKPEPNYIQKPNPLSEPEPNYRSKPKLEPEPNYRSKPKLEPEPNYRAKPRIEPERNYRPESNYKSKPKLEPEPKSEPKPKYESKHANSKAVLPPLVPPCRTPEQLSDYSYDTESSLPQIRESNLALPMPPSAVRTSPPTSSDSDSDSDTETSPSSSGSEGSCRKSRNSVTLHHHTEITSSEDHIKTPERTATGNGNLGSKTVLSSGDHTGNPVSSSTTPVKRSTNSESNNTEELGLYSRFLSENDEYEDDEGDISENRDNYPVESMNMVPANADLGQEDTVYIVGQENKSYTDKIIEHYWRSVGDDHMRSLHDKASSDCSSVKSDENLTVMYVKHAPARVSRTESLIDKVQSCQDELKRLSLSLKSQQKSRKPWFLEEMKRANKIQELPPPASKINITCNDEEEDQEEADGVEDEDELDENNEEDYDVQEEDEEDRDCKNNSKVISDTHLAVPSKDAIIKGVNSIAVQDGCDFHSLPTSAPGSSSVSSRADEEISKLRNDFKVQTRSPSPSADTVKGFSSAPSSSAPSPEPADINDFASATSSSVQISPMPSPELDKMVQSSSSTSSAILSSSVPSPEPTNDYSSSAPSPELVNNLSSTDTSSSSSISLTSSESTSSQAGDDINPAEDIPMPTSSDIVLNQNKDAAVNKSTNYMSSSLVNLSSKIPVDELPIPDAPCCSPSSSISAKSIKAKPEEECDDDDHGPLSPWFKESIKPTPVVEKDFEVSNAQTTNVLKPPKDVVKPMVHGTNKPPELPKPFTPPRNVRPAWDDTPAGYPIYRTKELSPSGLQLANKKQSASARSSLCEDSTGSALQGKNKSADQTKLKSNTMIPISKSAEPSRRNAGAFDDQYCSKSAAGSCHDSISSGASTQLSKSSKKHSAGFAGQPQIRRGGKIDRVARYAEMQKLWRKDSFLMANDQGGKRKGSQRFHSTFFSSSIQTQ